MISLSRRTAALLMGSALLPARMAWGEAAPAIGPRAPYGLKWGSSVEDIRKLGCDLTFIPKVKIAGDEYSCRTMPKPVSDGGGCYLGFGYSNRLWYTTLSGYYADNDLFAAEVLTRYRQLQGLLTEIYGPGREVNHMDDDFRQHPYLEAIFTGKAVRVTAFETDELLVTLQIRAANESESWYNVTHIHKEGRKRFEADRTAREASIL